MWCPYNNPYISLSRHNFWHSRPDITMLKDNHCSWFSWDIGVCYINSLLNKMEGIKKKDRKFSKYQLGAIQYYKCKRRKSQRRSFLNHAAAWTGAFSPQINVLAFWTAGPESSSERADWKCPLLFVLICFHSKWSLLRIPTAIHSFPTVANSCLKMWPGHTLYRPVMLC